MFHKGLNRESIVASAKELMEREGVQAFSLRKLAESLQVKTASLYAHIESADDLFTEVSLLALQEQKECLLHTIGQNRRDTAVQALADGYRRFAAEHKELYALIMQMPSGGNAVLQQAAAVTAEPFMKVLNDYQLSESQKTPWQRVLRGLLHGFLSEEQAGYFSHYPVPVTESYATAIRCIVDGLHEEERANHEQH